MKTVQMKQELADIEYKMKIELEKLKKGMESKNFTLVTCASKAMYELNPHVGYPRLPKRVRLDFMKGIVKYFQIKGIDVILPLESGIGEAIYFDILGERVGTLYGEHDGVLLQEMDVISLENIELFLDGKMKFYEEKMLSERSRVDKNREKIEELENLIKSPACIKTERFRLYRSVDQAVCLLGDTRSARFLIQQKNKSLGKVYERCGWILLLTQLKKPSCQKRLQNKIEMLREEMTRCEEHGDYSEERYHLLETRKNEFKQRFVELYKLLTLYHIPIQERKKSLR